MHVLPYDCASARVYTDSNAWPETMQLLPYCCASASVYIDAKRMAKSHVSTAIRLCISPQIHRHQAHGQKPCIYCHTIVHQPANTQTPNTWAKAMHVLPYDWASARVYKNTKRMAWSHTTTAILLCISQRIHRHQMHGLKPCIYCYTIVHQPANTQTPNARPKAMHLLPYDISSARVYTDTKRMAKNHASTAIRLCISTRIQSHQTHGLKSCIFCHTPVHQPANTQTPNAWPKAMHLLPYDCASARVYKDTKRMA